MIGTGIREFATPVMLSLAFSGAVSASSVCHDNPMVFDCIDWNGYEGQYGCRDSTGYFDDGGGLATGQVYYFSASCGRV